MSETSTRNFWLILKLSTNSQEKLEANGSKGEKNLEDTAGGHMTASWHQVE
jgi:hypothetical protein